MNRTFPLMLVFLLFSGSALSDAINSDFNGIWGFAGANSGCFVIKPSRIGFGECDDEQIGPRINWYDATVVRQSDAWVALEIVGPKDGKRQSVRYLLLNMDKYGMGMVYHSCGERLDLDKLMADPKRGDVRCSRSRVGIRTRRLDSFSAPTLRASYAQPDRPTAVPLGALGALHLGSRLARR